MTGIVYINGNRIDLANVKKTKTSRGGLTLFYKNGKRAHIASSGGGYLVCLEGIGLRTELIGRPGDAVTVS